MFKSPSISGWNPLTAAQICEGSEANAYLSIAATSSLQPGAQIQALPFAGGLCLVCATERTTTLFNRAIGLGLSQELDESTLGTLRARYEVTGTPWSVELAPAASSVETLALLKSARLRRGLATAVLAIECKSLPLPTSKFRIQRVGADWNESAAAIEADAFNVSPAIRSLLSIVPLHDRFRQWLAFDADVPIAACLTCIQADTAWFGWCATTPMFRGQGIQSAMLAHCISDAHQQGCRWMTAETSVGTESLPDRSYKNMLKFGFSEVYRRHSYIHVPRVASAGKL